jgi:branched-chain amino acid transport system permease protein
MGSVFLGVDVLQIIYAGGIYTGGYAGLASIPPLFATSRISYYYFFLGLAPATAIALYRFEFSRIGASLKAVSHSHLVASSIGINEGFCRILCVSIGCFFGGVAGAGYAHYDLVISGTSFNLSAPLWIVMYVPIGGIDSFFEPIIGSFALILIPEFFRDLKMYSPYISSGILLIVVHIIPKGLVSLPDLLAPVRKRKERRKIA